MDISKHNLAYDIERSKSKHACCCLCGEKIEDEFRLKNYWKNRFCHINCSGFTMSKIIEMASWEELHLSGKEMDYIVNLVRKS